MLYFCLLTSTRPSLMSRMICPAVTKYNTATFCFDTQVHLHLSDHKSYVTLILVSQKDVFWNIMTAHPDVIHLNKILLVSIKCFTCLINNTINGLFCLSEGALSNYAVNNCQWHLGIYSTTKIMLYFALNDSYWVTVIVLNNQ